MWVERDFGLRGAPECLTHLQEVKNEHPAAHRSRVWSERVKVNLSFSPPPVRISFTPVRRSLTQQLPSASQPRWALWWMLRSGLSLSPWSFTMQVCDDHLCCNSEWCRLLRGVSPLSQTLPACINCPRLHCQLRWCDLEEHRSRWLPTSLSSQRHARVDTGWFTELSVLN